MPQIHVGVLFGRENLQKGDEVVSSSKVFTLVLQDDGNLVLYDNNRVPQWASGTQGQAVSECLMQDDGNLVIYGFSNNPIWASGTQANPGSFLRVQDDGNVVIYKPNAPLWATGTQR
jgi:hypothetical protein